MNSTNMKSETLIQGLKFKKKINIIKHKKSNYIYAGSCNEDKDVESTKEGMEGQNQDAQQAQQVLDQNSITQSQLTQLQDLKAQFQTLLSQYQTLYSSKMSQTQSYSPSTTSQNVYVNSVANTTSSNFIGCYNNNPTTSSLDTSLWKTGPIYNTQTCQQAAIQHGYKYFGLQHFDSQKQTGLCSMTNNLNSAQTSGLAPSTMCNQASDGYVYGGTCSSTDIGTNNPTLINAVYQVPDAQYVGTFGDSPNRAMPLLNGDSVTYTYQTCKQAAINAGSKLFGLQYFQQGSQTAQCGLSNDFTKVSQYGPKTNQTIARDGKTYGGGWSNSVYEIKNNAQYIGCYPHNTQSTALKNVGTNETYTTCLQKAIANNQTYFALQNGGPGKATCIVGNDLSQFQNGNANAIATPCSTGKDGNQYGNCNANALYGVTTQNIGNPADVGKVGYVDENNILSEYPASMIGFLQGKPNTYTSLNNTNNPSASNFPNMPTTHSTLQDCGAACDASTTCVGYVYDSNVNNCWLKSTNPVSGYIPASGMQTFIKTPTILQSDNSCSKKVVQIDSVQWESYTKSSNPMTPATLCGLSKKLKPTDELLDQLRGSLATLADQIIQMTGQFKQNNQQINGQIVTDSGILNDNLTQYKEISKQFAEYKKSINPNILGIVSDSKIKVLQNNHVYVFWTILAIVTLIILFSTMIR